jgi:hypothetical protein
MKMNYRRGVMAAAVAAFGLTLAGCEQVSWLQPLYSERDIVQEPGFAGTWQSSGKNPEKIVVSAVDDHYRIEDDKLAFDAYLVRIAGELYIDAVEKGASGIPEHQFWKATLEGDRLELRTLSSEFVLDKIKKDSALPHQRVREGKSDTRYVVTAEPAEVQNFLIRYREQAWDKDASDSLLRVH